jgi:hypothetical protein
VAGKPVIYAFNGFFMSMRQKFVQVISCVGVRTHIKHLPSVVHQLSLTAPFFVQPGTSIYYYVVSWESSKISWDSFRGDVLGPTDPATAPASSLRGKIMAQWKVRVP